MQRRDIVDADLVSIITSDLNACGIAFLLGGLPLYRNPFSALAANCIGLGRYTVS